MSNESEVGIRIMTLSWCDICTWLKSELDGYGIAYTNIDAEQFSDFADKVEEKFKTEAYPIVFIEYGDKVITVVSETSLDTSDELLTFDNVPHLVGIIKTYLK